jgi:cytidylate kinase
MTSPTPPFAPRVRAPGSSFVVAIDGPAASGKSSTAQWVAHELDFLHVDSGSLYRAATAAALEAAPNAALEESAVLRAAEPVALVASGRSVVPARAGTEMDEVLRSAAVTQHVSEVARMPRVRAWVNARVRDAALGRDVVVDGRDMGTAVFPDAHVKVYLVADPWERARRRLTQRLLRAPTDAEIAEETERLVQRDARDAAQSAPAANALLIDTTYLTQEEQVNRIVAMVRAIRGVAR